MTNVTFNEEQSPGRSPQTPKGLYKLAIDWGLAKDEEQAKGVLLGIALVAALIAVVYPFLVL